MLGSSHKLLQLLGVGLLLLVQHSLGSDPDRIALNETTTTSRRLPQNSPAPNEPDYFYLKDDSPAVAGLDLAVTALEATKDPSVSSLGTLLVQASTMAPMLTLAAGPIAPVVGFGLMAAGTLLQAWDDSGDKTPTNADVLDRMDRGFDELNLKADMTFDAVLDNGKSLDILLDQAMKEELGFPEFESIREDYENAMRTFKERKELLDGGASSASLQAYDERLKDDVEDSKSRYDKLTLDTSKLGHINFENIIKYGIIWGLQESSSTLSTPTFCYAAELVQYFVATRYRLLWLMLMEANFQYSDTDQREVLTADMRITMERLGDNMESYDRVLRSIGSNDLLRAVVSDASQCKKEGFGTYCNHGTKLIKDDVMTECRCDVMWSGNKGATIGKSPIKPSQATEVQFEDLLLKETPGDDGALHHSCYQNHISCNLQEVTYLKNKVTGHDLAWWDGNVWGLVDDRGKPVLHADGSNSFSSSGKMNNLWQLESATDNKVYMKNTQKNQYLKSCEGELELTTNRNTCEMWTVEWAGGTDGVHIQNTQDKYLSIEFTQHLNGHQDRNAKMLVNPNGDWSKFVVTNSNRDNDDCSPKDNVFQTKEGKIPSNDEILSRASISIPTAITALPTLELTRKPEVPTTTTTLPTLEPTRKPEDISSASSVLSCSFSAALCILLAVAGATILV